MNDLSIYEEMKTRPLMYRIESDNSKTILAPRFYELGAKRYTGHVYIARGLHNGMFKVGITYNDVEERMRQLSRPGFVVLLEHVLDSNDYRAAEKFLHNYWGGKVATGEWFKLDSDDLVWVKQFKQISIGGGEARLQLAREQLGIAS